MTTLVTLPRFKSAVRKGERPPADIALRKDVFTTVEDLEDRRVRFTISTAGIDREGDSVAVDGWVLDAYRQNPVVLWAHDHYELPVGKCVEIGTDGVALKATVEFVPADTPLVGGKAEAILRMCRTGFLSATSVGFRPLEWEMAKERMGDDDWLPPMNFQKQELLEFSIVSIPCLSEALIEPGERKPNVVSVATQIADAVEQLSAEVVVPEVLEAARVIARERAARQRRARLVSIA